MLLLVQHEDAQEIRPKKGPNLGMFMVPFTIGGQTFTEAMLDLGASINVMLASIYKSLNLGDLEPTGMETQLANRSVIDVHAGTLSMEFWDTYVNLNIFEALKHLAEDHSIFSIDPIDGHMEEYFRLGTGGASLVNFVDIFNVINKFYTEAAFDLG
ncbi:hypothetical protein CR513_21592, partial [Mucuna pruriens]